MQLKTLGGLALEGSTLRRQRPLLLLAFVALQGGATRRELADLFFMHTADPRDSLSAAVSQLRRAARDGLVLDDNTVTTTIPCDAVTLLNDFDDFRFESVIKAYGGPFCAGYDQTLGEELEEWLFSLREQLAARARQALLHRSRQAAADGRLDDARRAVTDALALVEAPEPGAEEVAWLLPHLASIGSPELSNMLELASDLGVEPSTASEVPYPPGYGALERRFAVSSTFVGRSAELTALKELLVSPDERLITVLGLGGIGKSRLAERIADVAASELAQDFPDGVHRVYLENTAAEDDVETVIAARLGFPPEALVTAGGLPVLIRSWRALVVIDNFEHVLGAAPLLSAMIASASAVKLLVTSRVRLGLTGERIFALGGLAIGADESMISDAGSLFLDRASRVGLNGELTLTEVREIEALCSDLEGYPLGLELAAGMLRVLPLAKLRTEIRRSLDVLAQGPVDAPERHSAVRAAFEPSWRRLSRGERDAAMRISVFRGGCDFAAAATVVKCDLATLGGLVDQAFLAHDSRSGRFRFHTLVREFVAAKRSDALFTETSTAHQNYFAKLLDKAVVNYLSDPYKVLDEVAGDLSNILGAIEWALAAGSQQQAVSMAMHLVADCDYLEARGGGSEMVDLLERVAGAAAELGDLVSANRLLAKVGDAHRLFTSNIDAALHAYGRALELARRADELQTQVSLMSLIGALKVGIDREEATTYIEQALAMAEASGDELLQAKALNRAGFVAHALGDKEGYRAANQRAVDIGRRLADKAGGAVTSQRLDSVIYFALHNLGVADDDLGELEKSLEHRRLAHRFAMERGHLLWAGFASEELAFLMLKLGRLDEAKQYAAEARNHYQATGGGAPLLRFEERANVEDAAGVVAAGSLR